MGRRGRPRHPDILTPREWEVLGLLRERLSNQQIAERLGTTLDGAKYHVSQILSKLGVATREEAAAWRPPEARRRRWARWPLWAKIAGASALTAAAVALTVLGWAAIKAGRQTEEIAGREASSAPTLPQPTETLPTAPAGASLIAPSGPSVFGSYPDVHDFHSFAVLIDRAVREGDVLFFLKNTRFRQFRCNAVGYFVTGGRVCGRSLQEAVTPAVVIGMIDDSGAYRVDRQDYVDFLRRFLYNSVAKPDSYGDSRAVLYSYGVRTERFGGPSPDGHKVEAIVTGISDQGPYWVDASRPRAFLEFHLVFDGENWLIDSVSYGTDPSGAAIELDPGGAGAEVATGGPVWEFWQRWQPISTP